MASAMSHRALPARALRHRLQSAVERPSWVNYLPPQAPLSSAPPVRPRQGDEVAVPPPWDAACGSGRREHWQGQGAARSQVPEALLASAPAGAQAGSSAGRSSSARIAGSVWKLSRDPDGCREVQAALEEAQSEEARVAIAYELKGHVWDALRCPHANYVVQKCIVTTPPQASQFIVDELLRRGAGSAAQAARHRFGCRILERLLERCLPHQLVGLVEDVIAEAVALASHPYGNYVVQHILQHGLPEHQQRLQSLLAEHVLVMGSDSCAGAVVAKALTHGVHASKMTLARAATATPGILAAMARTRYGHVAVKLVLQLLEDSPAERATACRELEAELSSLRSSRYGRFVAICLGSSEGPPGKGVGSSWEDGKSAGRGAARASAGGA